MNTEQIKSAIRWFLTAFGGGLIGWVASRISWVSAADLTQLLTSEAFIGLLSSIIAGVWSLVARTNKNLVVAAAQVPEVKKIVAEPNVAAAVPSEKVVPK